MNTLPELELITPEQQVVDDRAVGFAPTSFDQYLGQAQVKEKLQVYTTAAKQREEEKIAKYGTLVRNMGCKFTPYVAETTGGLGPGAFSLLELIKKYAKARPAAQAFRFLQEQACIRARAYSWQVGDTAATLCGGRIGKPAEDPTLLQESEATQALNPWGTFLSQYIL